MLKWQSERERVEYLEWKGLHTQTWATRVHTYPLHDTIYKNKWLVVISYILGIDYWTLIAFNMWYWSSCSYFIKNLAGWTLACNVTIMIWNLYCETVLDIVTHMKHFIKGVGSHSCNGTVVLLFINWYFFSLPYTLVGWYYNMVSCITCVLYFMSVHCDKSIVDLLRFCLCNLFESMIYRFDMLMSCWQILYGKETMTYLVLMNNLWVLSLHPLKLVSVCKISFINIRLIPDFYQPQMLLIKRYNFTMVACSWDCQQALCRETYFRIGLPFTTGPFWLV